MYILKLMWAMHTSVIRIKIDLFVCYCLYAADFFSHRHRISAYFTQLLSYFGPNIATVALFCGYFDTKSPVASILHFPCTSLSHSWLEHVAPFVVNGSILRK